MSFQSNKKHPSLVITDDDVRRVKQDINLREFCIGVLGCKAQRGNLSSPFRHESNPSFSVSYYNGEWRWKDWGEPDESKSTGDIISLVQLVYNVTFIDAMKYLMKYEFPAEMYRREKEEEEVDRQEKVEFVRKLYYTNLLPNNDITEVKSYFSNMGVNYYPEMGSVIRVDFKEKIRQVITPLPNPWKLRGIEYRGIGKKMRKTLGISTLWFLARDTKKMLVTESILDSLAGEIILDDYSVSLVALNGVGNAGKLVHLVGQYSPEEVYLALDDDGPGRKCCDEAMKVIAKAAPTAKIFIVEDHIKAGAKDLYRTLLLGSVHNKAENQ